MLTKIGRSVTPKGSKARGSKVRTALLAAVVGSSALTLSPLAAGAVDGTDIISTVAGTGSAGTPGTEGTASTGFAIDSPEDVAVDSSGAVYYSDRQNHQVFKIENGNTFLVAGNGTAALGGDASADAKTVSLNEPRGISIDANDNLYIADSHNNRVRKVDLSTGLMTTVAGSGGAGDCGATSGSVAGDSGAATSATLNCPKDMVVNSAGVMYIADSNNDRIRMVASGGTITTLAGDGSGDGVTVGGFLGEGTSANGSKLSNPTIVVLDSAGVLFIADNGNNRIRKIAVSGTDGIITTVAGTGVAADSGDGGPATAAELTGPEGVSVDANGIVYLSDTNNHRIRKIATNGVITTIAGNGSAGSTGDGGAASAAQLNAPEGMILDADGNLFFAAVGENTIRKITLFVAPPVTPPPAVDKRIINGSYAAGSGDSGAVSRLYMAVLKRQPDAEGHAYWMTQLANGTDYRDIAEFFSISTEFQLIYGDTTNEQFVTLLYKNALLRDVADDQGGYTYWLTRLEAGYPRVDVVTFFSQSDEFKIATQTS